MQCPFKMQSGKILFQNKAQNFIMQDIKMQ